MIRDEIIQRLLDIQQLVLGALPYGDYRNIMEERIDELIKDVKRDTNKQK